jgi:DnaD/phage-associated family protein
MRGFCFERNSAVRKNLLISEPPLQVLPSLAVAIGLDEAIVLQQVHYWVTNPKNEGYIDENGDAWVYASYKEWQSDNFPFWKIRHIQDVFLNLENKGAMRSCQPFKKGHDQRKAYRPAYDFLMIDSTKNGYSIMQKTDDLNIESETTTKATQKKDISAVAKKLSECGIFINSASAQTVDLWLEKHQVEWIGRAIDISAQRGAKNINYIDKILIGWEANGYPKSRGALVEEARADRSSAKGSVSEYNERIIKELSNE